MEINIELYMSVVLLVVTITVVLLSFYSTMLKDYYMFTSALRKWNSWKYLLNYNSMCYNLWLNTMLEKLLNNHNRRDLLNSFYQCYKIIVKITYYNNNTNDI